jgi:hypothetical protein
MRKGRARLGTAGVAPHQISERLGLGGVSRASIGRHHRIQLDQYLCVWHRGRTTPGSEAAIHDVQADAAEGKVFERLRNSPDDVKSKLLPESHRDVVGFTTALNCMATYPWSRAHEREFAVIAAVIGI